MKQNKAKINFRFWFILTIVLLVSSPSYAAIGYHDVCVHVSYFDTRTGRSNNSGSYLTTGTANTNRNVKFVKVFLYDMDGLCQDHKSNCSEGDDDILGTLYMNSSGEACFPSIGDQEDLYFLTDYETSYVNMYTSENNNEYERFYASSSTFVNAVYNDFHLPKMEWNISCPSFTGGSCTTGDKFSFPENFAFANIIASVTDVVDRHGLSLLNNWNGHNNKINGHYPGLIVSGSDVCGGGGFAYGLDDFCITGNYGERNFDVAHEIGHLVHKRALDLGPAHTTLSGGYCGTGWFWDEVAPTDSERCAVSEGWASFFASTVYWSKSSTAPLARSRGNNILQMEQNTTWGNSGVSKDCVAKTSTNPPPRSAPGNVVRYFWDLYDSTSVADVNGTDNANMSMSSLLSIWDDFVSGTGNRHSAESGVHGRNIYDYVYYDSSVSSEQSLNCLTSQELN